MGLKPPTTIDARDWATFWLATLAKHPGAATDEGTMIGWFANAIMAGYDEGYRRGQANPLAMGNTTQTPMQETIG